MVKGMITLVLDCIDRLNVYNTAAHFSEYAGEEAAESWKEIVNLLYELLGLGFLFYQLCCGTHSCFGIFSDFLLLCSCEASLIRGNRANCALFCDNLDWLVSKLDRLEASSGLNGSLICVYLPTLISD